MKTNKPTRKELFLVCASMDESTEPLKVFFNYYKALSFANTQADLYPKCTYSLYKQVNDGDLVFLCDAKGTTYSINSNNRGGFWSVLVKNGQYYMADLSLTSDKGLEFMVFYSDDKGIVVDWSEVFTAYPSEMTQEAFKGCVNRFMHSH